MGAKMIGSVDVTLLLSYSNYITLVFQVNSFLENRVLDIYLFPYNLLSLTPVLSIEFVLLKTTTLPIIFNFITRLFI